MEIDVGARVKALLEQLFGIDTSGVTDATTLRDLGIDSMHVVNLMLELEQELDVELTNLAFPPNPTLGQVADTIARNLPGSKSIPA